MTSPRWHAIDFSDLGDNGLARSNALRIPGAVDAVLVRLIWPLRADVLEAVGNFWVAQPAVPRIAVLTAVPADVTVDGVNAAHRELCSSGADGVVLDAGSFGGLRCSVALAVEAAQVKLAEMRRLEAQIRGQWEERERLAVDAATVEVANGLFWEHAHLHIPSIPELDGEALPRHLEAGVTVGPCQLIAPLGRGAFGQAWAVTNMRTGGSEVVKVLDKRRMGRLSHALSLERELWAMDSLSHPNIPRLIGVFHGAHHVFVWMERAGRYHLRFKMRSAGGRLDEHGARLYQAQVLQALAHCHARGIAHCDVKPENLVVSDCQRHVRLVDFGCALPPGERCFQPRGTMPFMAPEVMYAGADGYEPSMCDSWSCGVLLYEMLCGLNKFNDLLQWPLDVSPGRIRQRDLCRFFSCAAALEDALIEDMGEASPDLVSLFRGLFTLDPDLRLTPAQAEESPWLHVADGAAVSSTPTVELPAAARPSGRRPLPGARPRSLEASRPRP